MAKIIHIDCDSFFVSVEVRDQPQLRGKAVAVGGSSDRRGVIATCSYEARRYGVRSAMATATALRLCPNLILLPARFETYRQASQQMHGIFRDYTSLIEPLSLDEAFLDVSHSPHCRGSASLMAAEIRQRIEADIGITASAGIAPNKFLAKVGSDWNKPNGQFVITPDKINAFMPDLPVTNIFGVGKVTAEKLAGLGVKTCGDLQAFSLPELQLMFGKFGKRMYELCRGHDERPVRTSRQRKSLSVERTFSQDLPNIESCLQLLPELYDKWQERLKKLSNEVELGAPFVKIKFYDFKQTTMVQSGLPATLESFNSLCSQAIQRMNKPVRLIGLGCRLKYPKETAPEQQLSLFAE